MSLGDYLFPAVGVAGAIWLLHAFKIIDLDPQFLPGVLAEKRLTPSQFRQDTFNTIFGAERSRLSRTDAGARRTMQQTIGGPGANLSQGRGGGL